MTDRLYKIACEIDCCNKLIDVGCDHGYLAEYVLKNGLAKNVIVSDVSAKSLLKAEKLLEKYIKAGVAVSCVSDGFDSVKDEGIDTALICGLGGELITDILRRAKNIPNNLILQPMKHCDKVRDFLVSNGYKILKDYVFYSEGKFYFLIKAVKGNDEISDEEREFGRTNVAERPKDFTEYIKSEIKKIDGYLQREELKSEDAEKLKLKRRRYSLYVET